MRVWETYADCVTKFVDEKTGDDHHQHVGPTVNRIEHVVLEGCETEFLGEIGVQA